MKKIKKTQSTKHSNLKYLLPVFIASLLVLGVVTYQNQQVTNVLGENASNKTVLGEEAEAPEEQEQIEEAEPTEAPEPTEEDEQEAEDIQDEIENEIEQGEVENVELEPTSAKQGEGTLKVERVNGTTSEKNVPISNTPLVQLQNAQVGTVAVSIGRNGTITLVNNGVTVTTNYPVIIDPKSQTIAVRTVNNVTLINTLPSQALSGVNAADKPTIIQTAVLGAQDGQAYYEITGTQERKFLGIMPVTANVQTKINANDGSLASVNRPWFLNLLGFLYTT
ncbi:MAG: hypothetical protein COX78_01195 [Candidatus Levybacteria bacterium CG_4_10_14_0_2_um_filter_35_8]|nr:MAG: hypothetical protein COX78_01195 [Candidatus Levybacteria bacterium CG_4_10_14_0_2_um_filter_35_8]PJC54882.1 MAG: hypothetical protein CO028_00035 [Candidatus Levybacteria bacterium CG_4_9_14_0_2_um_filter_35_21]